MRPEGPQIPSVGLEELPGGATLLDVRENDEWRAGHAPDAVHVPMSELTGRLEDVPSGPLAVICHAGGRSARVTAFLNANGWAAVNVEGGMLAWAAQGRPMTAEDDAAPHVL